MKPLTYDEHIIQAAIGCLESKFKYEALALHSPECIKRYLRLQLGAELNEVFAVLFLTNKLHLVAFEKLFQGSISMAIIYPRVVVQRALAHNAANVILVHNHPSGEVSPSAADKTITEQLKSVLNVIDVQVLDHFIVTSQRSFSFVESGLL
jgi:DNA repair protein RadC